VHYDRLKIPYTYYLQLLLLFVELVGISFLTTETDVETEYSSWRASVQAWLINVKGD